MGIICENDIKIADGCGTDVSNLTDDQKKSLLESCPYDCDTGEFDGNLLNTTLNQIGEQLKDNCETMANLENEVGQVTNLSNSIIYTALGSINNVSYRVSSLTQMTETQTYTANFDNSSVIYVAEIPVVTILGGNGGMYGGWVYLKIDRGGITYWFPVTGAFSYLVNGVNAVSPSTCRINPHTDRTNADNSDGIYVNKSMPPLDKGESIQVSLWSKRANGANSANIVFYNFVHYIEEYALSNISESGRTIKDVKRSIPLKNLGKRLKND